MKLPVFSDIAELKNFLDKHKDSKVCLYLAYKDEKGWEMSTSRVYMNQVLTNFLYIPVNVKKGDDDSLRNIYTLAEKNPQIVAINITQPHKNNSFMKSLFEESSDVPINIDTIVKNKKGKLVPYNVNAPSFLDWFNEEVDGFNNKTVVLLGVGGFGEPLARAIVKKGLKAIVLVDIQSKEKLREEISKFADVSYYSSLKNVELKDVKELVFINDVEKERVADNSDIVNFLEEFGHKNNIFVDICPRLDIDIVKRSRKLGWRGYTGHGMNAINDYTLLKEISNTLDVTPPPFSKFKELVKKAS